MDNKIMNPDNNKILIYTSDDRQVKIEVRLEDENILEKCLPIYLEEDLKNLKEGIKNNVSYLDCLINELQGSVIVHS